MALQKTPARRKSTVKKKGASRRRRVQPHEIESLHVLELQVAMNELHNEMVRTYLANPDKTLPGLRMVIGKSLAEIKKVQRKMVKMGWCRPCPTGWKDCGPPGYCLCCPDNWGVVDPYPPTKDRDH